MKNDWTDDTNRKADYNDGYVRKRWNDFWLCGVDYSMAGTSTYWMKWICLCFHKRGKHVYAHLCVFMKGSIVKAYFKNKRCSWRIYQSFHLDIPIIHTSDTMINLSLNRLIIRCGHFRSLKRLLLSVYTSGSLDHRLIRHVQCTWQSCNLVTSKGAISVTCYIFTSSYSHVRWDFQAKPSRQELLKSVVGLTNASRGWWDHPLPLWN